MKYVICFPLFFTLNTYFPNCNKGESSDIDIETTFLKTVFATDWISGFQYITWVNTRPSWSQVTQCHSFPMGLIQSPCAITKQIDVTNPFPFTQQWHVGHTQDQLPVQPFQSCHTWTLEYVVIWYIVDKHQDEGGLVALLHWYHIRLTIKTNMDVTCFHFA